MLQYFDINYFKDKFNTRIFVETGTGDGVDLDYASKFNFDILYSIEISEDYYFATKKKFNQPSIKLLHNNSEYGLDILCPAIGDVPILFWLDTDNYDGFLNIDKPIVKELKKIKELRKGLDVILINNIDLYKDLDLTDFANTHQRKISNGVLILEPNNKNTSILKFYNHFHNGDLHVSREFVKDLIKKINPVKSYYYHYNDKNILKDINVEVISDLPYNFPQKEYKPILKGDDILINTWYNSNTPHFERYDANLKTLYLNFKYVYNDLNIEIEPIEYYIPDIDFTMFNTFNIEQFFNTHKDRWKKHIMIVNSDVASGQATNFDFTQIIKYLAENNKENLFISTEKVNIDLDNVIWARDISSIYNECDLNENAYISTFCDVIIGRCSGSYTFAVNKYNFTSNKKQTFVSISNIDCKWYDDFHNKNKKFLTIKNFNIEKLKVKLNNLINPQRLFDCFIFYNELDMLALRLDRYYDVVDYFVIVEAELTHTKHQKPLYFLENKEKYAKYLDKIIHYVVFADEFGDNALVNEHYQRNQILNAFKYEDSDVLSIVDVDEFPNYEDMPKIDKLYNFDMDMFYYYMNCKSTEPWDNRAYVGLYKDLKNRNLNEVRLGYIPDKIRNGGHHFSYIYGKDVSKYMTKVQSFCHQEYNTEYWLNPDRLANCIENNIDLFERQWNYTIVNFEETFPEIVKYRDNMIIDWASFKPVNVSSYYLNGLIHITVNYHNDKEILIKFTSLDSNTEYYTNSMIFTPGVTYWFGPTDLSKLDGVRFELYQEGKLLYFKNFVF